ncbi:MAG: YggT family protein [bacterium]|nr:YggT family protein [bacterium]
MLTLARLIHYAFEIYTFIVIARVVLSWIPHNPQHSLIQLIYQLTEPPLKWIRQWLPSFGGLDLSPLVLIIGLIFIERIVLSLIL